MNTPAVIVLVLLALILFVKTDTSAMFKATESKNVIDSYRQFTGPVAQRFSLPESRLLAIIVTESSGRADSVGAAGEVGLMQITAGALAQVNGINGWRYTMNDLFDPLTNVLVGGAYLAYLYSQTHSMDEATRAYNGGLAGTRSNPALSADYVSRVNQTENTILSLT